MNETHHRAVRRGLPAVLAAGVVTISLGAGPALGQAGQAGGRVEPAEIVMKLDGTSLRFAGAKEVVAGEELEIRNATAPRRIGPHSFTLAAESLLPKTRKESRRCFSRGKICFRGGVAHQANPRTGKVGRQVVRVGEIGWDRMFTRRSRGDSWFTQKKGETFSQVVSAPAGTTLSYFCLIHPEMRGKIDVVEGDPQPTP